MKQVPLEQLSAQQFAGALRSKFQVMAEGSPPLSLELISVTEQSAPNAGFEAFSLLFNGPTDPPLAQKIYRFTHEQLGAFDLFIVPVSANSGGRQYEAVFNRRLAGQNI